MKTNMDNTKDDKRWRRKNVNKEWWKLQQTIVKAQKKKQARNALKVVRVDKNFILGDAMSVKKYGQSVGGSLWSKIFYTFSNHQGCQSPLGSMPWKSPQKMFLKQ